jgi:hypothetical protein
LHTQFTASYNDLKFTLYRYGYCIEGLQPITKDKLNETEYLTNQIKSFLDHADYDNEQLANISSLIDTICLSNNIDPSPYLISVHVDIPSFNSSINTNAKDTRCEAINKVADTMYHVFRRAALNRSEPLDFSSIRFYPNETDKSAFYNLTDLINISWIMSEVALEKVCSITDATKDYIKAKSSSLNAQPRQQNSDKASSNSFLDLFNRFLERILGIQKQFYWESTNRFEYIQSRLSNGLSSVRDGIGYGLGRTRDHFFVVVDKQREQQRAQCD